jgi:arabinose-5-phosphate isomerase
VCQTLVSTGTRSIWLAPVDALHGDIGNVSPGDIVVMLSKSGTTEELTTLVPYAKAKGGFIVAATNNPDSKLAQMADMHVTVPSNGGGWTTVQSC